MEKDKVINFEHDTETFLTKSLCHVVAHTLSGSYHYNCLFIHCHLYLISDAKVERMPFKEVAVRLKALLLYGSIKTETLQYQITKSIECVARTIGNHKQAITNKFALRSASAYICR